MNRIAVMNRENFLNLLRPFREKEPLNSIILESD